MGLVFQILERFGTIPWDEITLPEGRTKKACALMIDKEKTKVKKAREAAGETLEAPTPKKVSWFATFLMLIQLSRASLTI